MKYNQNGLNKLVKELGMEFEIARLLEMGLNYEQLTEVFDSILNPSSPLRNEGLARILFGVNNATIQENKLKELRVEFRRREKRREIPEESYNKLYDLAYRARDEPTEAQQRRYNTLAKYFGINTSDDFNFQNLSRIENKSHEGVRQIYLHFKRSLEYPTTRKNVKKEVYYRSLEKIIFSPEDF